MRKNGLAAAWAHWFRAKPLVPDEAFQGRNEPYPGHWRRFPEPWPGAPGVELLEQAAANTRAVAATIVRCERILSMN